MTKAAIIELIDSISPANNPQGVMRVNELRINGVPVLVPRGDFLKIEGINNGEDGELIVSVRMFARQIVIGEPR